MAVSNQNIVKIGNRAPFDKTHTYSLMHTDSLQKAMCNLKGETLKLWLYCNKNQNNYQFDLSQKALQDWGLKKDAYQAAKKKLVELGYLVPLNETSNILVFYEDAIESEKPTKNSSEIQIESEKPTTVIGNESEIQTMSLSKSSEKPTTLSEIQTILSEKPQRNNTIIHNSTIKNNTESAQPESCASNKSKEEVQSEIQIESEKQTKEYPLFHTLYPGISIEDLVKSSKATKLEDNIYEVIEISGKKVLVKI